MIKRKDPKDKKAVIVWKTERICVRCFKTYIPSYKPQQFCGNECAKSNRVEKYVSKTQIEVQCKTCLKKFIRNPSSISESGIVYCSKNCRKVPLDKKCKACGKDFQCTVNHRFTATFCSRSCAHSGKFHHYYGKSSPAKGRPAWTKGLNAKTDPRLASLGRKISMTQKEQFVSGIRNNFGAKNPNYGNTADKRTPEQRNFYSLIAIKRLLENKDFKFRHCKTGWIYSNKMNQPFHFRSSLEKRYFNCLENDTDVTFYDVEPFTIKYDGTHRYLPDVLVHRNTAIEIIEVKPNFMTTDPAVLIKQKAAEKFCKERNWDYKFATLQNIIDYEKQLNLDPQKIIEYQVAE